MTMRLVLAVAADGEVRVVRHRREQREIVPGLWRRHLRAVLPHEISQSLSVVPCSAIFIVSGVGARFGNQTSYQLSAAKRSFGTPRGGRRTVPMRSPSPATRGVPSLTMRTAMKCS